MENIDSNAKLSGQRSYRINLRLTEAEFKKLAAAVNQTLHKSLSSYARKLLLGKPVTILTRDESKDKAIYELSLIRAELSAVANNFNQVVKRIHRLDLAGNKNYWLVTCTRLQKELLEKIDSIQQHISKMSKQWS
ncbi:hypothetical protein LL912_12685 [Niabella sp. CC-SYL272]|uniref:plasmid mobilization protein n=1 Tax=Niabella agricola TaxID=2891571 RepID=UPI001F3D415D|nr:hypothetical protein [Niabella agricola]MCF3109629.1 hypothetical protein [Niabella agricola]